MFQGTSQHSLKKHMFPHMFQHMYCFKTLAQFPSGKLLQRDPFHYGLPVTLYESSNLLLTKECCIGCSLVSAVVGRMHFSCSRKGATATKHSALQQEHEFINRVYRGACLGGGRGRRGTDRAGPERRRHVGGT